MVRAKPSTPDRQGAPRVRGAMLGRVRSGAGDPGLQLPEPIGPRGDLWQANRHEQAHPFKPSIS